MAEKCPICGEEFSSLEDFERHERQHHHEGDDHGARARAEQRQRAPGPAAGPGGNPVVNPNTGEIETP